MTDKIQLFYNRLEEIKKVNPDLDDNEYGGSRHTYCHLILMNKNLNYPKFEVRSWNIIGSILELKAVNWTVAGGSALITLNKDNIDQFKILEDNPTIQVLYG